jgi:hypothetical protein
LRDLNEIAARIVEHGGRDRAHDHGRLRELNSHGAKALVLRLDVTHRERRVRNPVFHERLFEGTDGTLARVHPAGVVPRARSVMSDDQRVYSDKEFALILRKAA